MLFEYETVCLIDYMTHVVISRVCHMIQFNVYGNERKCTSCVVLLVESDEPCWTTFLKILMEINLFSLKMYTTLFLFGSSRCFRGLNPMSNKLNIITIFQMRH
jgi:hypothetical protein